MRGQVVSSLIFLLYPRLPSDEQVGMEEIRSAEQDPFITRRVIILDFDRLVLCFNIFTVSLSKSPTLKMEVWAGNLVFGRMGRMCVGFEVWPGRSTK